TSKSAACRVKMIAMPNHLFAGLLPPSHPSEKICISVLSGRDYMYGDVRRLSACYAAAIVALGVTPGDRVAALVEKSPEALFLYLGCVRAGAVFLPLNTAYT